MIFLTFVHQPPDAPGHNFHHHHWQIYRAPKPILVSTLVQVRNDVANVLYAPTPAASSGGYGDQVMASNGKGEVTSLTFDTFHKHQASLGAFLFLHVIMSRDLCLKVFKVYPSYMITFSKLWPSFRYSLVISIKLTRITNMFRGSTKRVPKLWLKVRVPVLIFDLEVFESVRGENFAFGRLWWCRIL